MLTHGSLFMQFLICPLDVSIDQGSICRQTRFCNCGTYIKLLEKHFQLLYSMRGFVIRCDLSKSLTIKLSVVYFE